MAGSSGSDTGNSCMEHLPAREPEQKANPRVRPGHPARSFDDPLLARDRKVLRPISKVSN
jgi:hypothetical protein